MRVSEKKSLIRRKNNSGVRKKLKKRGICRVLYQKQNKIGVLWCLLYISIHKVYFLPGWGGLVPGSVEISKVELRKELLR
jgi:hypothetical protein